MAKLRKDLEEAHIQNECTLVSLRKKHAEALAECSEQTDLLNKMKHKIEKDKSQIFNEIVDVRAATDEVNRSKASAEKNLRGLMENLNNVNRRVEECNLTLGDMEQAKRRTAVENAELMHRLQELETTANLKLKKKASLQAALDEATRVAEDEAKERTALLAKFRNTEHEAEGLRQNLDEEVSGKENLTRQLAKALADGDMWKKKYEIEGMAKAEELETAKLKLQARLSEGQATIEQLNSKLYQLEKSKASLETELNKTATMLDQAQMLNASLEKKAKQADRILGEWKHKVEGLGLDLDGAQKETRNISSDLFHIKNAYDEAVTQLDEVRKENHSLSIEIKDIMDQITEGGRSIHEIDKIRKRLEAEKLELEAALSEAEGALEQEENKVLRANVELTQVRQEIERRLAEKEDEFFGTKKNFAKALEGIQMALDMECKGKVEALRMKKKLESDVVELETELEHANAANVESQRSIKVLGQKIREVQLRFEEESRAKSAAQENLLSADRRCHANQNALEEARTLLEQSDRSRRVFESELVDTNGTLSDQTCQNQVRYHCMQDEHVELCVAGDHGREGEVRAGDEHAGAGS